MARSEANCGTIDRPVKQSGPVSASEGIHRLTLSLRYAAVGSEAGSIRPGFAVLVRRTYPIVNKNTALTPLGDGANHSGGPAIPKATTPPTRPTAQANTNPSKSRLTVREGICVRKLAAVNSRNARTTPAKVRSRRTPGGIGCCRTNGSTSS